MAKTSGRKAREEGTGALMVHGEPEELFTPQDERAVSAIVDAVEEWVDEVEDGLRRILGMVLRDVFDGDPKAMLAADRASNPRFAELQRRLEGRERLTDRHMTTLCRVFAYDELVKGRYWSKLRLGVKEKLLPLVGEHSGERAAFAKLNAAAKQAIAYDFDAQAAAEYVRKQLRLEGRTPRRNAGHKTYERELERSLDLFGSADGLDRLLHVAAKLDATTRSTFIKKLNALSDALRAAERQLRREPKG